MRRNRELILEYDLCMWRLIIPITSSNPLARRSILKANLTPFWEKLSVRVLGYTAPLEPSLTPLFSSVRNVYTLINPGDTVDDVNSPHNKPYIQMVGTTNRDAAHADFVKARLNGVDTTGAASQSLLPHGQTSPLSPGEKALHVEGFVSISLRWATFQ